MPITDIIRKEIVKFSTSANPGKMVPYLKDLINKGEVTAKEVLDYARDYKFTSKPEKPYVIIASIVNRLGVAVEDTAQKEVGIEFFKLAADRNSSWGCRNYAQSIIDKDKKSALFYAKKSVDLVKDVKDEKHEHKFVLCKALRKNREWKEANVALVDYFQFKTEKLSSEKNEEAKKKLDTEFKEALDLFKVIIKEFLGDFEEKNKDKLTTERCRANLEELESILACKPSSAFSKEFEVIQNSAYYIKAKCHEQLGERSEAMLAYCAITNKDFEYYSDVIKARVRLLKFQISDVLPVHLQDSKIAVSGEKAEAKDMSAIPQNNKEEKKEEHKNESQQKQVASLSLTLPSGVPFTTHFGYSWLREASWFDSVDENEIKDKFEKRLEQIKKLISAKKTEIELIEEVVDDGGDNLPSVAEKKKNLEDDLVSLETVKKALDQEYKKHLPDNRQPFRRYAAESRFFNPKRLKKRKELVELTNSIIDQRFQHGNPILPPLNLAGKSSRQVITAERAFQEASIALTGEDNPILGIPRARVKPWTVGWGWDARSGETIYGPIERYQVGESEVQSEHRTSPKRARLGDSFLPQHGTYSGDIYPFLKKLAKEDKNDLADRKKEKQLASFMVNYGKKHQTISLSELKDIYPAAEKEDVDQFNRICFLIMEKEQGQWHSANNKKFHLGMSVSQARCLIMLKEGFIGFEEAFKNNTLFGVYSQTGIVDDPSEVASSCQRIDRLYTFYLQNKNARDHFIFLKKHIKSSSRTCVLTRVQAHRDMQEVYGGESDSDIEDQNGYETEVSIRLK